LPKEGWFALGGLLTVPGGGAPVLLSWSGSMFEYLMPTLVMPGFSGSLLDQTCSAAVARQIAYGAERGVPWGVSESAYNVVDVHLTYQYRAFGVPGLGLKRGLSEDMVVAPYASALALLVAPGAAAQNLRRLSEEGAEGQFGLYEAIDYTEARLPRGHERALIRSYMAHHQGMSLLAFAHVLLDRPMQRRFESDPQFQATMLLLQERVPRTAVQYLHATELPDLHTGARNAETIEIVNTECYLPIRWTIDTLGWKGTSGGQSAETVIARVLDGIEPGAIVLMHLGSNPDDGSTLDADALPAIVEELRTRGYRFVTVDSYT